MKIKKNQFLSKTKTIIWNVVRTIDDMPKKSDYYLMCTDMGWYLTFYWDRRKKRAYILSNRNYYDPKKSEYVDLGKIDSVRMSLKNPTFVWTKIPQLTDTDYKKIEEIQSNG